MILALDSSTTGCSVALFHEGKVLSAIENRVDRTAAENLTLMIAEVLRLAGVEMNQLKAVAVGKGPGSYTGLRIAVSTAKGLAFARNIPLISFGTLPVICEEVAFTEGIDLLCPMIDARRMEVFCGFYKPHTLEEVHPVEAVIVKEDSFTDILDKNRVLFLGEGSAKCEAVIHHKNAHFLDSAVYPTAASACAIVTRKFVAGEFEDLVTFEPFYLKEYMFKTKKK